MTTANTRPPVKLAITFPGYSRTSYIAVCRGNEQIATLLDQFVYYASARLSQDESFKVLTLEWSHKDILEKLPIHMSRTTLIGDLDKLNAWGFVRSERYGRAYTVDFEAIQQAVNHPPGPEKRTKTGGRTAGECSKVSNLKLSELERKVTDLKHYVSELELKVSKLEQIVSKTELLQLPSAPSEMPVDGQSEKAPVYYCPITDHTDLVVLRTACADADTHTAPFSEDLSFSEDETPTVKAPAVRLAETVSQQTPSFPVQEIPPQELPAASVVPVPGNTDGATEATRPRRGASRASGTRKPKATKPEAVDPARVAAVFDCMDSTMQRLIADPEFRYARTKAAQGEIADLIRGREVGARALSEVMEELYNKPVDKRTGFNWQEHMTVKAICNNYDRTRIALRAKGGGNSAFSKYANPDTPDGSWPDGMYFDDQTFLQPKQRPGEDIAKYYSRMMVEDGDARLAQAYAAQLPQQPEYAPMQA